MNKQETNRMLEDLLKTQISNSMLIIALYLPSDCILLISDLLSEEDPRPGSVGRYCNIPVYDIAKMDAHPNWETARYCSMYYGYIKMDNID